MQAGTPWISASRIIVAGKLGTFSSINAIRGNLGEGMGPRSSEQSQRQPPLSLLGVSQEDQVTQL